MAWDNENLEINCGWVALSYLRHAVCLYGQELIGSLFNNTQVLYHIIISDTGGSTQHILP